MLNHTAEVARGVQMDRGAVRRPSKKCPAELSGLGTLWRACLFGAVFHLIPCHLLIDVDFHTSYQTCAGMPSYAFRAHKKGCRNPWRCTEWALTMCMANVIHVCRVKKAFQKGFLKVCFAVHANVEPILKLLVEKLTDKGGQVKRGQAPKGGLERDLQSFLDQLTDMLK